MIDKIIVRLKQPSTLKGAVVLAGLLGYTIGPDDMANPEVPNPPKQGLKPSILADATGDIKPEVPNPPYPWGHTLK